MSLRTPLAVLLTTAAATGLALTVSDQARSVVEMAPVGVWFANDDADSVSHVGPAGADATVEIVRPTGRLTITELDGIAYVTDEAGRLSRIDPAQLVVSQEADRPTADSQLIGGGGRLYVVDRANGTIRELDPAGLTTIGETATISSQLGLAVVDDDGVLWVPDLMTGEVVSVDGRRVTANERVGQPGDDIRLAVVDGVVVSVNSTAGTVTEIAGGDHDGRSHPLDVDDDGLNVPTTVGTGSVLPVVDADGLVTIDLNNGDSARVDLGVDGHRLGVPAIVGNRIYVPDYTDGTLIVVDAAQGIVLDTLEVTGEPGTFELVVEGDRVFVNDPASEQAWSLDSSGTLVPVAKYDPSGAGGGPGGTEIPPAPGLDEPDEPDDASENDQQDERDETAAETPPDTTTPSSGEQPPQTTAPPVVLVPPATTLPAPGVTTTVPGADPNDSRRDDGGGQSNGGTDSGGDGQAGGDGQDGGGQSGGGDDRPAPATTPTTTAEPGGTTTTHTDTPTDTTTTTTTPTTTVPLGSGAVTGVVAQPGDGQASVSWQAPQGWLEVREYRVSVEPSGGEHSVDGTQSTFTVNGLANGDTYTFAITALADGAAGLTVRSNAVTPTAPRPDSPRSVTASAGDGQVAVTWQEPANGRVTGYVVEIVPADGSPVLTSPVAGDQRQVTVTGLANGADYHAVVRATVDGVAGSPAATSSFAPRGRPGRPGSVGAAVTGSGEVTVSWSPASSNGSSITQYTITAPGLSTSTEAGDRTQTVLNGLTIGNTYTFSVTATNAVGSGDVASSAPVVVQSLVPGAPGSVSATAGDGSATITWTTASANGSTIASYRVRNVTTGATQTVPASDRDDVFGGLANGTAYVFEVQAVAASGTAGPARAAGAITPSGAVPAPTGLSLSSSAPDAVWVTFDAPSTVNGNTISDWVVSIDTATPASTTVTTGAASFSGLRPATSYDISVVARATDGRQSPATTISVTTPGAIPDAVTDLQVDFAVWANVRMSWTASPFAEWYVVDPGDGSGTFQVIGTVANWDPLFTGTTFTATVTAFTSWGSSAPVSTNYYVEPDPRDECGGGTGRICP